jgi:acid phosphatase family membrane protein YuiD
VVSLTVYIGLRAGFASVPFAIAFVFGILAVRDAIGFRKMIGDQAKVINAIVASQSEEIRKQQPRLIEEVGHTPLEAFVGSCFGAIIALLAWYFI